MGVPLAAVLLLSAGQLPREELDPLPEVLARVLPGVVQQEVPVRRAVTRIAAANGAAVAFVRGVDPTTPVSLEVENRTVAEALAEAAGQGGAAVVGLGGAVYVAPPAACAAALRLAADRRAELKPTRGVRRAMRERALAEQNVTWPDATPPRAILDDVVGRFGLTVEGADSVPHDLWPAGRLPAADAPAALAAVLAPCGLTFVWTDDRTGVVIAPAGPGAADPPPPLTAFAAKTVVGEGGGVPLDRRAFALTVTGASVRRIMAVIPDVRFEYDARALAAALETKVDVDVTGADADEFFTALFEPAGIAFSYEGTVVTLTPADP